MLTKALHRKIIVSFVFLLASFFTNPAAEGVVEIQQIKTTLIANIDFVPELLEMIRQSFCRQTGYQISLAFQPFEKKFPDTIVNKSKFLLIEEGAHTGNLPTEFIKTGFNLELAWVLVVKNELYNLLNQHFSLQAFNEALLKIKARNPHSYPWFDSMYSKTTLLHFLKIFGEPQKPGNYEQTPFWQQPGAIRMLYRAMEEGLLNPLSVEADQMLATKVFLAGDSLCFSTLVPIEFLKDQNLVEEIYGQSKVIPFPDYGQQKVLRIRLNLWKIDGLDFSPPDPTTATESALFNFCDINYLAEQQWFKEGFSQNYDQLIMGEF